MCLIAFAWNPEGAMEGPAPRLLVVANRDEYYVRPTLPADWWEDAPDIWAGRDLTAGGTWLGITREGRFAALTNYREPIRHDPNAPSRGKLVSNFLLGSQAPAGYLERVAREAEPYNGFNLLVGDLFGEAPTLCYFSHRRGLLPSPIETLAAGVYGVSNALLDTPWPKVVRTTAALATLKATEANTPAYLQMLSDTTVAEDEDLPSTGLSLERERELSAPFIITPDYGTRSQTVLKASRDGRVQVAERSFDSSAQARRLLPVALRQADFEVSNTARR